jgi:hypothetical protein
MPRILILIGLLTFPFFLAEAKPLQQGIDFKKIMAFVSTWANTEPREHLNPSEKDEYFNLHGSEEAQSLNFEIKKILNESRELILPIYTEETNIESVHVPATRFLDLTRKHAFIPTYANSKTKIFSVIGAVSPQSGELSIKDWSAIDRIFVLGIPIPNMGDMIAYDDDFKKIVDGYVKNRTLNGRLGDARRAMGKLPHIWHSLLDLGNDANAQIDNGSGFRISDHTTREVNPPMIEDRNLTEALAILDFKSIIEEIARGAKLSQLARSEIKKKTGSAASYGLIKDVDGHPTHILAVFQIRALEAYNLPDAIVRTNAALKTPRNHIRSDLYGGLNMDIVCESILDVMRKPRH